MCSYYFSFETFFKDKAQGISNILDDLSLYQEQRVDTIPSPKAELSFTIEGFSNVWRLLGIHPRFGPSWALVTQDNREVTHEIKGSVGDIFKIECSNDVSVEFFARCYYNLTWNTGGQYAVSYTHLRAHETDSYLVCRLLLEKKKRFPL